MLSLLHLKLALKLLFYENLMKLGIYFLHQSNINNHFSQQTGSSAIFKRAISEAASVSAGYGGVGMTLRNNRNTTIIEKKRDNTRVNINDNKT